MKQPVCNYCGGINIDFNRTVVWNMKKQEYTARGDPCDAWCHDCEDACDPTKES